MPKNFASDKSTKNREANVISDFSADLTVTPFQTGLKNP
jgi:hypothetical protein